MRRRLLLAAVLLALAAPLAVAAPLAGVFALPEGAAKVAAVLIVTPDSGLRRTLDIVMVPAGGTAPIRRYETELSKQLHVVAVSADLRDFVHEHGDRPDADGHFRVAMSFPHAGPWHIYADAVPQGLGQQVMRFELPIAPLPAAAPRPDLAPTGLLAADGRYAARFDTIDLKAGDEVPLSLHLLRDGQPAPDITPFLGVAAHAVFIDAGDLSYVHVHALPAAQAMAGMEAMQGMAQMAAMAPPMAPDETVPPDLALHVRAPRAGTYVLWVQFDGGGAVRTVRFVIPVR